jgi:hypothetical protein
MDSATAIAIAIAPTNTANLSKSSLYVTHPTTTKVTENATKHRIRIARTFIAIPYRLISTKERRPATIPIARPKLINRSAIPILTLLELPTSGSREIGRVRNTSIVVHHAFDKNMVDVYQTRLGLYLRCFERFA